LLESTFAPGMRIEARDCEWVIKQVDFCEQGGYHLLCDGLSELVRGRQQIFLTAVETQAVRILDPAETELADDTSSFSREGLLYLETLLRQTPATGDAIALAHEAAIDRLNYQYVPAIQALRQPRQRILIADAVGLGKTLEAGILLTELIARGRGKRVLVLAVKSMLSQFQQELWNRFTIPLTRLDSAGIQRLRNQIPGNHNPFHYIDKAIVSIDTLKQDLEYRHYLENAYWDVIVIDEAHNVAQRGGHSQRSQLAELLATRSDTLIMLSATPHDGRAESFASLVNMLDPTSIANPHEYGPEDYQPQGLVVRRMKKDVQHQLKKSFPERHIEIVRSQASAKEEAVYTELVDAQFKTLDKATRTGTRLFRSVLEKALFSSPAACASVIANRLAKIDKQIDADAQADKETLTSLLHGVQAIEPPHFTKYQRLIELLKDADFGWDPSQADDRLVIFTEAIPTQNFLAEHLPKALKLKKNEVESLRGSELDTKIASIVESFGKKDSPIRLLICSEVASEGINLHHQSHRLVHFDIPWSLMRFQQRNGRVDRYGQTRQPQIRYLITDSSHPKIAGDNRVLEVLIEKDDQASTNLGDPSEFLALSEKDQEELTAQAMESPTTAQDPFMALLQAQQTQQTQDEGSKLSTAALSLQSCAADSSDIAGDHALDKLVTRDRLYSSCYQYTSQALSWLRETGLKLELETSDKHQRIRLGSPLELLDRLRHLPSEAMPENNQFTLVENKQQIEQELQRCREEDGAWPQIHYLWDLHPVVQWLQDRIISARSRHSAPVIRMPNELSSDQHFFCLRGGYPNRRGHGLIDQWLVIETKAGAIAGMHRMADLIEKLNLKDPKIPATGNAGDTSAISALLPSVVAAAEQHLKQLATEKATELSEARSAQQNRLDKLRLKFDVQLNLELERGLQSTRVARQNREQTRLDRIFKDFEEWVEHSQTLEDHPWLQVAAVFTGQAPKTTTNNTGEAQH